MGHMTLKDYWTREEGKKTRDRYEIHLTLSEFYQAFQIPSSSGARRDELFLDVPDLEDRLSLMQERLDRLNARIREYQERVKRFEGKLKELLEQVRRDLMENIRTFRMVEENPSASARRTFLEGQAIQLERELYELRLRELDRILAIERERDEILPEYLHLKRVLEALVDQEVELKRRGKEKEKEKRGAKYL